MRLLCYFERHKRDRRQITHDNQDFVSICARCGVKMRKLDRGWVSDPQEPAPTP